MKTLINPLVSTVLHLVIHKCKTQHQTHFLELEKTKLELIEEAQLDVLMSVSMHPVPVVNQLQLLWR